MAKSALSMISMRRPILVAGKLHLVLEVFQVGIFLQAFLEVLLQPFEIGLFSLHLFTQLFIDLT